MPERREHPVFDVLRPIAITVAAGYAAGKLAGAGVTLRNHRELTHKSLVVSPILQKVIDLEQRTVTVDTKFWAGVHRIHHLWRDTKTAPFSRIANGVKWMNNNPEKAQGVEKPKKYRYLDPFVEEFTEGQVLEIGNLTTEFLKEKLGKRYKQPESYTTEELVALLNPQKPTYLYSDESHEDGYTQEEMQDILTSDPHSPALFPGSNGVRTELLHIPKVNKGATDLLRTYPDLLDEDLQSKDGKYKKPGKLDMALGFGILSLGVLIARGIGAKGKLTPRDFLIAAIQGSAINSIKIGFEIIGGNSVNSLGHMGTPTESELVRAIGSKEYTIQPNKNGTAYTDARSAGWIGRFFTRLTLDEVGGQKEHHDDPSKIAYTSETGLEAWRNARWGSFVSFLAENKWFPLIKKGKGFDLKPGERRPDEAHPAVELIEQIRAEQAAPIQLTPPPAEVLVPAA